MYTDIKLHAYSNTAQVFVRAGSGRNTSQDTNTVGENPEIYLPERWLAGSMSATHFALPFNCLS